MSASHTPELMAALEAVIHSLSNPPIMSREAQEGFRYHTAEEEYRVQLCRLIIETKEAARAAIAKAKGGQ